METSDQEIAERKANAEALLPHFSLERVLNTGKHPLTLPLQMSSAD